MSYEKISKKEINEICKRNPMEGMLAIMANANLNEAEKRANGKPHTPSFHDSGFSVCLTTPNGYTGLWSCWLQDRLSLHYSLEFQLKDKILKKTLQAINAKPVVSVSACAVNNREYTGEYKDPDKPLEKNKVGQIVAYRADKTPRKWADFYSPEICKTGGRVWIERTNSHSYGQSYGIIEPYDLATWYAGHTHSRTISTYQFSFCNKYANEGPTAIPAEIQPYRDRFLELLCKIAEMMGGVTAVDIEYGFVLVPEQLPTLGYEVKWLKGIPGTRNSWGDELVLGIKGDEQIMLKSANSLVPWVCHRKLPVNQVDKDYLLSLLTF